MTRGDRILITILALVALILVPVVALAQAGGDHVVIEGPYGRSSYAIDEDRVVEVQGRSGIVSVEIAEGSVRVIGSDCPDGVCMSSSPIDRDGGVIACVPNGVTVSVRGDRAREGVDAISR